MRGGEGDEVQVDREQDQLDRHQDDDDVLAVQEDAENAQNEQDGGHHKVVAEADGHHGWNSCIRWVGVSKGRVAGTSALVIATDLAGGNGVQFVVAGSDAMA